MESSKSKVIRIVNLPGDTKNYELTAFLKERLNLQGEIKEIYIRNECKLHLVFAYVIFEFSLDAKLAVEKLNCAYYESLRLDVAQIAPNGIYQKYLSRPNANGLFANWNKPLAGMGLATSRNGIKRERPGQPGPQERSRFIDVPEDPPNWRNPQALPQSANLLPGELETTEGI